MTNVGNINPKKIIIVEDEHDLRVLYEEILIDAGYKVEGVVDGVLGLEKILNEEWDLLLLDIMLPGKDGIRILKEISAIEGAKKGPIISLTNLNSEWIIKEAFDNGADGYLIKSEITPDKIVNEVKSFLG